MDNKDKQHKKYFNQKSFLINNVLHEIFESNRNIIKKLPCTPLFQPLHHPGPRWKRTNMEKIHANNKY